MSYRGDKPDLDFWKKVEAGKTGWPTTLQPAGSFTVSDFAARIAIGPGGGRKLTEKGVAYLAA